MGKDLRETGPAERLLLAGAFAVIWLVLLWFPVPTTGVNLDQGYGLALGHFLKTGKQAGGDWVFTYGPLGYLAIPLYYPGLFPLRIVWALLYASFAAWVLTRMMTLLPSRWLWSAWVFLVLAWLPRSETQFIVVPVVAAFLHVAKDDWAPLRIGLTTFLLATLALVKFTLLVLAVCLVIVLVMTLLRRGRRRTAGLVLGSFCCSYLAFWLAAGQSLGGLPRYLSSSMELVRGYSEAMSLEGSRLLLHRAIAALLLLGAALFCVPRNAWRTVERQAGIAILLCGLFLAWKQGFVRQDPQHASIFFGYAGLMALGLLGLDRGKRFWILRGVVLGVVVLGAFDSLRLTAKETIVDSLTLARARARLAENARTLGSLGEHGRFCARVWKDQHREWELPAVRERVRGESIDVVSFDQSVVFWNDLDWRPRPILQGYSAYTPRLARMNAEFFAGPRAPRFVLCRWMGIDRRFPAQDDGLALIEILRRYRPVLSERDYILLERRAPDEVPSDSGTVVLDRPVAFGETVPLALDPKLLHTLSVQFEPTVLGRLRRLAFRVPRVQLEVKQAGGELKRYELIPGLSGEQMVLSPLVEGNVDLPRVYKGEGRRVTAIRLVVDEEGRACFGQSGHVVVTRYAGVALPRMKTGP